MLQWHIANPKVGEFTWELPENMQARLLGAPIELRQYVEQKFSAQIEGFLYTLMGVMLTGPLADRQLDRLNEILIEFNLSCRDELDALMGDDLS